MDLVRQREFTEPLQCCTLREKFVNCRRFIMHTAIKNSFVLLIVVSYSITFPVLPLIHSHPFPARQNATTLVQSSAEKALTNTHPVSCIICSRINSAQALVNCSSHFSPVLPFAGISFRHSILNWCTFFHTPTQVRAPPFTPA